MASQGHTVPPKSDLGCHMTDRVTETVECNIDMSPADNHHDHNGGDIELGDYYDDLGGDDAGGVENQGDDDGDVEYTVDDLAMAIMGMFRVHIFLSADFGGDGSGFEVGNAGPQLAVLRGRRLYDPSQWFWISLASEAQQRAQAVIDEALLAFNSNRANLDTWFGEKANKKKKISKVLNTISKVVKHMHFHAGGPDCVNDQFAKKKSLLAIMYSKGKKCSHSEEKRGDKCLQNYLGFYLMYIGEPFTRASHEGMVMAMFRQLAKVGGTKTACLGYEGYG